MTKIGLNPEPHFRQVLMVNKFPTTAYVASRLQKVGWDSVYGVSLLNIFRDDLVRECGSQFADVLRSFRRAI